MAESTASQILSTAPYHLSLLQTLDSLQYAPSALTQQSNYIRDLEAELKQIREQVKKLGEKTKKERKEHEEIRNSTTRRLTARLKGKAGVEKFEAKKEKEEREYVEALENEMQERGKLTMLENMVREAKGVKSDLEEKSTRLKLTKEEISNLYHQVFDGPTAEFPRDDELERERMLAQSTYDRIQQILNSHSQAVNLLSQADQTLGMSLRKIDEALSYSSWDVYGGGSLADMMERDALSNASVLAAQAQMLFNQAQRTSSDVQSIGPMSVHDISIIGDVLFDNIFSDIRAHHKIQKNRAELAAAHRKLQQQLRSARQRAQLAGADIVEASEVLRDCNKALDEYRREVYLSMTSGQRGSDAAVPGSEEALPGYGETANTTLVAQRDDVRPAASAPPPITSGTPPPAFSQYPPPPGPPPPDRSRPTSRMGRSRTARIPEPDRREDVRPAASAPPPAVSQYRPPSGPPPPDRSRPTSRTGKSGTVRMPQPEPFVSSSSRLTSSSSSLSVPSASSFSPSTRRSRSPSISHRRSKSSTPIPVASSESLLPPGASRHKRSSSAVAVDKDKPLPSISISGEVPSEASGQTVLAADGDAGSSNRPVTPDVVPKHWGNKNPFAAMMMVGLS